MPPNGKPYALNIVNGVIYTATAQGCGGVPNAFYSYDLATGRPARSARPAAACGAAAAPRSRPRASSTCRQGTRPTDPRHAVSATPSSARSSMRTSSCSSSTGSRRGTPTGCGRAIWMSTSRPMVFDYQGRKFLVGTSKECRCGCSIATRSAARIIGRPSTPRRSSATTRRRSTPRASGARWPPGRIRSGTQWVLVPFWGPASTSLPRAGRVRPADDGRRGGVQGRADAAQWKLAPAWLSRDMDMAEEDVVAGGVVFAYGVG